MLLTETNKLLIEQELKLLIQLFPKKMTKRKVYQPYKLTMIRQPPKPLLLIKKDSKLTTTKEEEPLQLPETPWDSSTPKTRESTESNTVKDSLFPNKETKLNSTEPWTEMKSTQPSSLPSKASSDPSQKTDLIKLQSPPTNHTSVPLLTQLLDNLFNNYNQQLKLNKTCFSTELDSIQLCFHNIQELLLNIKFDWLKN